MISTTAKRGMVIALVAGFSFGIGMLLVPPPEEAEATVIDNKTVAKCVLDHMGGVGSDRAADYVVLSCRKLS